MIDVPQVHTQTPLPVWEQGAATARLLGSAKFASEAIAAALAGKFLDGTPLPRGTRRVGRVARYAKVLAEEIRLYEAVVGFDVIEQRRALVADARSQSAQQTGGAAA